MKCLRPRLADDVTNIGRNADRESVSEPVRALPHTPTDVVYLCTIVTADIDRMPVLTSLSPDTLTPLIFYSKL